MPETAADRAPSRRRLALPLTLGLALWGWGHSVLALPGAYDDEGRFQSWALAAEWVLVNAGSVLALVSGYRLARRLESHLVAARDRAPQPEQPVPTGRRRRSPGIVLIAVGAALIALLELQWVFAGPGTAITSWVLVIGTVLASIVAPAAMTLGVYLALRRLEDHLAGKRPDEAPTKSPDGGGHQRPGLTTPYVKI